ncbi:MAG: xanthine dehydrogenase family protein molybdopterin-binding subunit, partial [Myxococcota bacterium]
QNTDGSSSGRGAYDDLRRMGATAREMLVAAAAKRWKVDPKACVAKDGAVTHPPTGRRLPFGELADAAARLPVPKPAAVKLRPREELTHVNRPSLPLLDGPAIVAGTAVFGADMKLPGMLVAVIARPPVVGGKLAKMDATRARAVPGVRHVIELPAPAPPWMFQQWGGVAVLADDTWTAMRGRAALDLVWEAGENASYDSAAYRDTLHEATRQPGTPLRNVGDVDAALASAARVVEAEYYVPHLGQLPMEPPTALAVVADGRCEIWAPTQHPQSARTEAATVLGLDEKDVTVHVTLLGGAFGRKSKSDFIREAAFLAREAKAPVRVQWTREDDVRHGYYNTVNAQRLRAGLDAAGKVVA